MTIAASLARMRMRRHLSQATRKRRQRKAERALATYAAREVRKATLQAKYGLRW